MIEKLKALYRFLSPRFQNVFLEYRVNTVPRYGYGKPAHQLLQKNISQNHSTYIEYINEIIALKNKIQEIKRAGEENSELLPVWNNGYLPGLDMACLYMFISKHNPKKYVEVGSGNSTKVVAKAKADFNLNTHITSIDPYPRTFIDDLAQTVIRKPFENIDLSFIAELNKGDILFIDNSHRSFSNSDVTVFFLEALPLLKPGVIIHIHDIYLPYDYPHEMCNRFYNEQYLLACTLLANPDKYEILFPAYYISENRELSSIYDSLWNHPNVTGVEKHGGSWWMRVK